MSQLRFLVSLITKDNDYQREQAASARAAAQEFGVDVEIVTDSPHVLIFSPKVSSLE